MNVLYQLPQYVVLTAAEILFSIQGLAFSYAQVRASTLHSGQGSAPFPPPRGMAPACSPPPRAARRSSRKECARWALACCRVLALLLRSPKPSALAAT